MANYKRKGPKSTRAGCLLCKPHKRQGTPTRQRQRFSQFRNIQIAKEQLADSSLRQSNHN